MQRIETPERGFARAHPAQARARAASTVPLNHRESLAGVVDR